MSKKESRSKGKLASIWNWLRRRNLSDFIAALALVISAISLLHDIYPSAPRAKLTIFIEHHSFYQGTANELNVDIFGTVVNDSPLTALIRRWELVISVNMSYNIVSYRFNMPDLSLSPSEQVSYSMGQVLWGDNETKIPETAIKGCIAWFEYEDDIGLQTVQKELTFQ